MNDEIQELKAAVIRLEKTLFTLIAWQVQQFGEHGVKQLFDMLDPDGDKIEKV